MRRNKLLPWLLLTAMTSAYAQVDGRCVGHTFEIDANDPNQINDTIAVRVIRDGAAIYEHPTGSDTAGQLAFGEVLQPLRRADANDTGRIQIERPGLGALGWMDRIDLLCRNKPLRTGETGGIERKAFIRTDGASHPVQSYPGPDADQCTDYSAPGCRELSRFDLLFVYAEDDRHDRLLLSFEYSLLDDEAQLVGWVPKDRTIPWQTRYGLRPADNVDLTWLYANADAAYRRNATQRYPVKGNDDGRWHTYPMHLPIIDKEELGGEWLYKVAAPGPKAYIDDDPFAPTGEGAITALKGVDVLFLIDGTRSMGPYIAGAAQAAGDLARELTSGNTGHRGNHYRFGYRIYRDGFADKAPWNCTNGVCDGLALDRADCGVDPALTEESRDTVMSRLRSVQESTEINDALPEALFAGIDQAIQDLGGCDERLKVLIVIGDHGDNGALSASLERKIKTFAKDFLIFFVQTPQSSGAPGAATPYRKFREDAGRVLRLVYGRSALQDRDLAAERDAALLSLANSAQTRDQIIDLIDRYTSSEAVNEVLTAVRAGEALDDFLATRMESGDMPILFWERVYSKLCDADDRRLGRQCTEPVDHVVGFGYVRMDDDDWTKEVWLDVDDLGTWIRTLRGLSGTDTGGSASARRNAFVGLLLDEINRQIGEPPIPETGETLEEFSLRKNALPVREHSPMLGYELPVLRQVKPCELRRLQNWADASHRLLTGLMGRPQYKPSFILENYPENCVGVTDNGRRIPRMDLAQPSEWGRLGQDARASYEQSLRGSTRYWLPQEFLP